MNQKLTLSIIFGLFIILVASEARADFLGLAPGDYAVTLNGSSSICGGSNCTGTVHIGPVDATGFDWNFTFPSDSFGFDSPSRNAAKSPDLSSSCAVESTIDAGSNNVCIAANGSTAFVTGTTVGERLFNLTHTLVQGPLWAYAGPDGVVANGLPWVAVPATATVPEPASSLLLLIGAGALGCVRWMHHVRE